MIETIRYDTFETNSSSCHCITFVDFNKFDKFKNGELYLMLSPYGLSEKSINKYYEETEKVKYGGYKTRVPGYLLTIQEVFQEWLSEEYRYYNRGHTDVSFNEYLYDYYHLYNQLDINESLFIKEGLSFYIFKNHFELFTNGKNIFTYDQFIKNSKDEFGDFQEPKTKKLFMTRFVSLDYYARLT